MEKQLTAAMLAQVVEGEVQGNPNQLITGLENLRDATPEQVSFLTNRKYKDMVEGSKAGTIIVGKDCGLEARESHTLIVVENAELAVVKATMVFAPEPVKYAPGVHPSAVVAESAELAEGVHVGANAVIEENVKIGPNTVIAAGAYVGHQTTIGAECIIYQNVSIRERSVIGNKVILNCGVVIGGDGYGFAPTPQGPVKIPQVGYVRIDDDVEIGANSTVDRGRFGKTWIKSGVKIDNLVMIAHNVEVGEGSLIIALTGIAGSARIGRGVILAAQSGVNGHITIGDGVKLAATSSAHKSIDPGKEMLGTPAEEPKVFMERYTLPKKVRRLNKKIENLELQIEQLKSKLS